MADVTTTTAETGAPAAAGDSMAWLTALSKRGDIALALGIVTILVVLILPLPRWLLDFSLATSIAFAALILMVALFISRPLDTR